MEDLRPRKRQRTSENPDSKARQTPGCSSLADGFDGPTRLALDHLAHDDPSHPLYERNIEQALDGVAAVAGRKIAAEVLPASFQDAMSSLRRNGALDATKVNAIERRLAQAWSQRILRQLATGLDRSHDFAKDGQSLKITDEQEKYLIEFTIKPILSLDDGPGNAEASRSSKISTATAAKAPPREEGSARRTRSRTRASATRPAASQQTATPIDSNSGDEDDSDSGSDSDSGDSTESSGSDSSDGGGND